MARGIVGIGSTAAVSSEKLVLALNWLPFIACVAAVVGLCIKLVRHRVLHGGSETDGEKMELRNGGDALSSNFQMKRNSFKDSFPFKHSLSRSVNSRVQGNVCSEDMSVEPTPLWQKVILRGERCVPLSFSGLVLYDEKGNLLPRRNKSYIAESRQ